MIRIAFLLVLMVGLWHQLIGKVDPVSALIVSVAFAAFMLKVGRVAQ